MVLNTMFDIIHLALNSLSNDNIINTKSYPYIYDLDSFLEHPEGILKFLVPFSGLSKLVPAVIASTSILIGLATAL